MRALTKKKTPVNVKTCTAPDHEDNARLKTNRTSFPNRLPFFFWLQPNCTGEHSNFSIVRIFWGQQNPIYYQNYLLSRNVFREGERKKTKKRTKEEEIEKEGKALWVRRRENLERKSRMPDLNLRWSRLAKTKVTGGNMWRRIWLRCYHPRLSFLRGEGGVVYRQKKLFLAVHNTPF